MAVADRRRQPGRLAGGVAGPEHTPAGVLLADFTDDEERRDAHPPLWQDNQTSSGTARRHTLATKGPTPP